MEGSGVGTELAQQLLLPAVEPALTAGLLRGLVIAVTLCGMIALVVFPFVKSGPSRESNLIHPNAKRKVAPPDGKTA